MPRVLGGQIVFPGFWASISYMCAYALLLYREIQIVDKVTKIWGLGFCRNTCLTSAP